MKLKQLVVARRLVSRERTFNEYKMDPKATGTLTVNNIRVTTHFATNVSITLIRQSVEGSVEMCTEPSI
jgi:hypothetical protein